MAEQESLVLGLCSYMLNVEHIRLAPTLFGARVMRIEPLTNLADALTSVTGGWYLSTGRAKPISHMLHDLVGLL